MDTWGKPNCHLCKKPIERRSDSVLFFAYFRKAVYWHAACYAGHAAGVMQFGAPMLKGMSRASGKDAIDAKISNAEKLAAGGNRKKIQASITDTMKYSVIFTALLDLLFLWGVLNFGKLKFDLVGWLAFAVLCLLGLLMSYSIIMYFLSLREHEALIRSES